MLSQLLLLSASLSLAQPQGGQEVPRVALEVLNSGPARMEIFHLQHAVGPEARGMGERAKARALILLAVGLDDCTNCEARIGRLVELVKRSPGGMAVVVVYGQSKDHDRALRAFRGAAGSVLVTFDGYGLARQRLGLPGPGYSAVYAANGQKLGAFGPMESGLEAAMKLFARELSEDGR